MYKCIECGKISDQNFSGRCNSCKALYSVFPITENGNNTDMLKGIIKRTGMTRQQFAEHNRINPRTLKAWLSGQNGIADHVLYLLYKSYAYDMKCLESAKSERTDHLKSAYTDDCK